MPWTRGLALLLALAMPAHAARAEREEPQRVVVFAAASLTDVVLAVAAGFEGARVVTSFGASSELARQIADGAPADVYLSASPDWMEHLREAGALAGAPVVVARNQLVAVAPLRSPFAAGAVTDPAALLAQLAPGDLVAIADEGVPAGEYARAALARDELLEAYRPRLVGQKDVRAVLHAVEQGEVRAGFVYATDARVAAVTRLFAFDVSSHPPISCHAAALRGAPDPEAARRFVSYLQSGTARGILREAGFALP